MQNVNKVYNIFARGEELFDYHFEIYDGDEATLVFCFCTKKRFHKINSK